MKKTLWRKISIADVTQELDGAYSQMIERDAAESEYDNNRLLYIIKKGGTEFGSGRKGSNCSTAISETVRKSNTQLFREFVKREKYAWSIDSPGYFRYAYAYSL